MKLLLVLFACVAAANAFSYSYQYYCSHQFHVYPTSSCYRYIVYCPSTWCSTSYYAPILKVYPGDDCGTSGFTEKTPEEVVTEMRNLLNASLSKMARLMYSKRNAWIQHLDKVHGEYKSYFKKYLYMFYTYRYRCGLLVGVSYISERDNRIKQYCAQLDKIRSETYVKYNAAIAERIAALKKYHSEILKQGEQCLNTRVKKIAEFRTASIKKIHDGIIKFAKLHLAILNKKRDYYHQSLWHTFAKCSDFWTVIKGASSVSSYYAEERKKVEIFVKIYAVKLATHYKKVLNVYTCAYRCYMSNGCIRFQRKTYYQACRRIGTCTSYKTNYGVCKYFVHPFTFTYKSCVYKNLKTCDVNEDSRNSAKVIADLKKKRDQILSVNNRKFITWKIIWIGYSLKYKAEYQRIVRQRHSWYCGYLYKQYIHCNGYLTSYQIAEIAKLKSDLKKQAEQVCRKYYSDLYAKIYECVNKHNQRQAAFKKSFDYLIAQLQAKYNECAAKKKVAIADYEKKIKAQRDAQRARLVSTIYRVRDSHLAAFEKMLAHFHGSNYKKIDIVRWMLSCYRAHIYRKVGSIIGKFDSSWRSILSKLVHHFTCSYRCTIRACVAPRYYCGSYYSWCYKLPTIYSYSYQLSCYRRYY